MKSVYDAVLSKLAVAPISQVSGSPTAIAIDTKGYSSAIFVIQNGVATGTPTSYAIAAQVLECATSGGSYADVSGATASITADTKIATIRVEGLGTSRLRYLKLYLPATFVGGTTPAVLVSGLALLGRAYKEPVGNSATQG